MEGSFADISVICRGDEDEISDANPGGGRRRRCADDNAGEVAPVYPGEGGDAEIECSARISLDWLWAGDRVVRGFPVDWIEADGDDLVVISVLF